MKKLFCLTLALMLCAAAALGERETVRQTLSETLETAIGEMLSDPESTVNLGISEAVMTPILSRLATAGAGENARTHENERCGTLTLGESEGLLAPFVLTYTIARDEALSVSDLAASCSPESLIETLADARVRAGKILSAEKKKHGRLQNSSLLYKLKHAYKEGFSEVPLLYYRQQGIPVDSCWDLLFFAEQTEAGETVEDRLYLVCRQQRPEETADGPVVRVTLTLSGETGITEEVLGALRGAGLIPQDAP